MVSNINARPHIILRPVPPFTGIGDNMRAIVVHMFLGGQPYPSYVMCRRGYINQFKPRVNRSIVYGKQLGSVER
jgi:hypothetical protein